MSSYGIKEHRRHGEAASVDVAAVEKERKRLKEITALYAPRDRFNFDESGLFGQCVHFSSSFVCVVSV